MSLIVMMPSSRSSSSTIGSVTAFSSAIMFHAFFIEISSEMPGIFRISMSRTRVPMLLTYVGWRMPKRCRT